MSFLIFFKFDARVFLIWALLLNMCKRRLIILLIAIMNKYVPDEVTKVHVAIIKTFLAIMYWMLIATKYPKGFLQSNGNLHILQNAENIHELQELEGTSRIFKFESNYHIGAGNWKASLCKPVDK